MRLNDWYDLMDGSEAEELEIYSTVYLKEIYEDLEELQQFIIDELKRRKSGRE